MGVAIMGSLINSTLATQLAVNTPARVRESAPPTLLDQLRDPQFLLSPQQLAAVRDAFQQLGPEGPQLFQEAVSAVKTSLATAIGDAFWVAMVVTLATVFVGAFLREIPLRRVHDIEGEPAPAGATVPAAGTASTGPAPVAGASDGPTRRRPLAYAAVGAGLAFVLALAAFLIRRNGS